MEAERSSAAGRIPSGIWVLGFVSLLMDVSSELIHSLLPVFPAVGLGASALTIGLIEGVAEATALGVKVFSGTLSDYLGRRKTLAVVGYGLGALSKPFFALATSAGMVFGARFVDRIGKGIRGAPRDALIADLGLALPGSWPGLIPGIALWGLHLGISQGLLARMVADAAPADLRGTAFGFFNLLSGGALLLASAVAGLLWDRLGAPAPFVAGAVFGLLALGLVAMGVRDGPGRERA